MSVSHAAAGRPPRPASASAIDSHTVSPLYARLIAARSADNAGVVGLPTPAAMLRGGGSGHSDHVSGAHLGGVLPTMRGSVAGGVLATPMSQHGGMRQQPAGLALSNAATPMHPMHSLHSTANANSHNAGPRHFHPPAVAPMHPTAMQPTLGSISAKPDGMQSAAAGVGALQQQQLSAVAPPSAVGTAALSQSLQARVMERTLRPSNALGGACPLHAGTNALGMSRGSGHLGVPVPGCRGCEPWKDVYAFERGLPPAPVLEVSYVQAPTADVVGDHKAASAAAAAAAAAAPFVDVRGAAAGGNSYGADGGFVLPTQLLTDPAAAAIIQALELRLREANETTAALRKDLEAAKSEREAAVTAAAADAKAKAEATAKYDEAQRQSSAARMEMLAAVKTERANTADAVARAVDGTRHEERTAAAALFAERDAARKDAADQAAAQQALRAMVDELRERLDTAATAQREQRESIQRLEKERAEAVARGLTLTQGLESKDRQTRAALAQAEATEKGTVTELRAKLDAETKRASFLADRVANLEAQLSQTAAHAVNANRANATSSAQASQVSARVQMLEQMLMGKDSELAEQRTRAAGMQERLEEATRAATAWKEQLSVAQSQLMALQDQLRQSQSQHQQQQQQLMQQQFLQQQQRQQASSAKESNANNNSTNSEMSTATLMLQMQQVQQLQQIQQLLGTQQQQQQAKPAAVAAPPAPYQPQQPQSSIAANQLPPPAHAPPKIDALNLAAAPINASGMPMPARNDALQALRDQIVAEDWKAQAAQERWRIQSQSAGVQ